MKAEEMLEQEIAQWKQAGKVKIDARKHAAVQDMLGIIMNADKVSCEAAATSVVNKERFDDISATGWGSIAVSLWGHADMDRKWYELKSPVFEMEVTAEQIELMADVLRYHIDDDAVHAVDVLALFLVFEMQSRGYHI